MYFLDSSYIINLIFKDKINHTNASTLKEITQHEQKLINNTCLF